MSVEELLQYVPPIARYCRAPLDDRSNALSYWGEAAAEMVRLDDALYGDLVGEQDEVCGLMIPVRASHVDRVRPFLVDNEKTFELLRAGVRCGQIQFPQLEEEGGSISEHAESMHPLAELAQAWSVLAQSRAVDGDLPAAVSEFVALGHMGHIICCGEGLVMHYLTGCAIMRTALAGIQEIVTGGELPAAALEELSAAIDGWIATAGDVAQCLRVDLCSHALRELERLAACRGLEARVDELLERHYAHEPLLNPRAGSTDEVVEDDGRLAWRRERILYLLEGHPAPFDKIATARLMGRLVADRILELQPPRRRGLAGRWGRLKRAYRRSRFRSRTQLWPGQLRSSFPVECLGPSEAAQRRLAELKEHLSAHAWGRVQPPNDEELAAARRRICLTPNAFGNLAADAMLVVDISRSEGRRRRRLDATKAAVSRAQAAAATGKPPK